MPVSRTTLSTPQRLFPLLVAGLLFVGAVADLLDGAPGDATALFAAFVAMGIGALLLWPDQVAEVRPDGSPVAWRHQIAFALFGLSAVAVFGKIAADVVEGESTYFDRGVSLWAHRFDTPTLDIIMRGFSFLGEFSLAVCCSALVLMWCWFRKDRAAFGALVGAIAADYLLKDALKDYFHRPRPTLFHEVQPLHSYSFPSAHAMVAVAIYGTIALVAGRLAPRFRSWIWCGFGVLALMIGYSRVYLGVHWVTDVLGGFAVGAAILAGASLWLQSPSTELRSERV